MSTGLERLTLSGRRLLMVRLSPLARRTKRGVRKGPFRRHRLLPTFSHSVHESGRKTFAQPTNFLLALNLVFIQQGSSADPSSAGCPGFPSHPLPLLNSAGRLCNKAWRHCRVIVQCIFGIMSQAIRQQNGGELPVCRGSAQRCLLSQRLLTKEAEATAGRR